MMAQALCQPSLWTLQMLQRSNLRARIPSAFEISSRRREASASSGSHRSPWKTCHPSGESASITGCDTDHADHADNANNPGNAGHVDGDDVANGWHNGWHNGCQWMPMVLTMVLVVLSLSPSLSPLTSGLHDERATTANADDWPAVSFN